MSYLAPEPPVKMPDSCQSLTIAATTRFDPVVSQFGQIPDEVRLDDVALQSLVLHQLVEDGLIFANEERPVGVVLQAQRHTRGAVVAEAERVVPAERHAVAETPGRGELHRVIRPVERLPLLVDVRVAADRPQQLLHVGAGAGHAPSRRRCGSGPDSVPGTPRRNRWR